MRKVLTRTPCPYEEGAHEDAMRAAGGVRSDAHVLRPPRVPAEEQWIEHAHARVEAHLAQQTAWRHGGRRSRCIEMSSRAMLCSAGPAPSLGHPGMRRTASPGCDVGGGAGGAQPGVGVPPSAHVAGHASRSVGHAGSGGDHVTSARPISVSSDATQTSHVSASDRGPNMKASTGISASHDDVEGGTSRSRT